MEELRRVMEERWQRLRTFCQEQPKQAAEAGALVLLLCFAAALFLWKDADDERLALKQPPPTSVPADATQNSPSRLEVKGADEAEAAGELRNPFSMLHETREQMAAASAPSKEKQPQAAEKPDAAKAVDDKKPAAPKAPSRASVVEDASAAEPPAPALVLKGVASGNGQTLAVIRAGGKSHLVAEGETVGGYTVAAIGDDSVTLAGDGGTLVLQLSNH